MTTGANVLLRSVAQQAQREIDTYSGCVSGRVGHKPSRLLSCHLPVFSTLQLLVRSSGHSE